MGDKGESNREWNARHTEREAKDAANWSETVQQNDASFEKLLDDMYYQYHYHPTNIPHFNDPKASTTSNFWGALADTQTKRGAGNSKWVDGLPRGSRSTEAYVAGYSGQGMSGGACVFFVVFVVAFVGLILYALPIISKSLGW